MLDAGALERSQLELDRPLLAAVDAVAVVDHEDARAGVHATPSAGSTSLAMVRTTACSRYGASSSRARRP